MIHTKKGISNSGSKGQVAGIPPQSPISYMLFKIPSSISIKSDCDFCIVT